jgi:hypothetical protein
MFYAETDSILNQMFMNVQYYTSSIRRDVAFIILVDLFGSTRDFTGVFGLSPIELLGSVTWDLSGW